MALPRRHIFRTHRQQTSRSSLIEPSARYLIDVPHEALSIEQTLYSGLVTLVETTGLKTTSPAMSTSLSDIQQEWLQLLKTFRCILWESRDGARKILELATIAPRTPVTQKETAERLEASCSIATQIVNSLDSLHRDVVSLHIRWKMTVKHPRERSGSLSQYISLLGHAITSVLRWLRQRAKANKGTLRVGVKGMPLPAALFVRTEADVETTVRILERFLATWHSIRITLGNIQTSVQTLFRIEANTTTDTLIQVLHNSLKAYCEGLDRHYGDFSTGSDISLCNRQMLQQIIVGETAPQRLSLDISDAMLLTNFIEELRVEPHSAHLDVLQHSFSDPLHSIEEASVIRDRLRHLQILLYAKYEVLPNKIFISAPIPYNTSPIAGGALSDIYTTTYNGRRVALKRLRVFQVTKPTKEIAREKAFYNECLVWWGLDHPHLVPLLGIEKNVFPHTPCLVMPWMDNGDIRRAITHMLHDQPISSKLLCVHRWLKQIVLGLSYLHSRDIAHGALRSVNILIDEEGKVRLTDFGLFFQAHGKSQQYAAIHSGADHWMAPELLDPGSFDPQERQLPFAADIYAFACVCVEVYSDNDPFPGVGSFAVAKRVVNGDRPERPTFRGQLDMPDRLWQLIQSCWSHSPRNRPSVNVLCQQIDDAIHL